MKKNMNTVDRFVRALLAITFFALWFTGIVTEGFGIALLILAIIFSITVIFGYCPLYTLFRTFAGNKKQ